MTTSESRYRWPDDGYGTPTSYQQAATEDSLIATLPSDPSAPLLLSLFKAEHIKFIARNLIQGFPVKYMAYDASQPWLVFWTVQSLSVLGVALDPVNKQKIIDTIMAWQHPDGGFGGGPGQAAHLLTTYAAVCSLAVVGHSGDGGGWDDIDRKKLYKFFMSLKQPDGSFLVAHHSEVDVRGVYGLLVVAVLLDIVTPDLLDGTAEFVAGCQTFEGGFASSSFASSLAAPRAALGEAHGGYTSCAFASWVLLQPTITYFKDVPTINRKRLVRWLVQMQGEESELGGFKGRTNKLVDGCYSWWVGGVFNLLTYFDPHIEDTLDIEAAIDPSDVWTDENTNWLCNREAVQEYILVAGQNSAGGLRDKPSKSADAYHTLYCLAGLSGSQHKVSPSRRRRIEIQNLWKGVADTAAEKLRQNVFVDMLSWVEVEGESNVVGGSVNRVNATHPVCNLTISHTLAIMNHFYRQDIPAYSAKKAQSHQK